MIAAAAIFIAAVATTQTAIGFMSRHTEQQVETLGHVYLDGLSAAILPYALADDLESIRQVLQRALEFHEGVVDRRLIFMDAGREIVADARRAGPGTDSRVPHEVGIQARGALPVSPDGHIWIWREIGNGGEKLGIVVADLDISSFLEGPRRLRWALFLLDLALSAMWAVAGFYLLRWLQQPVSTLTRHLNAAALGRPRPIPESEFARGDREAAKMFRAYNTMARAGREREVLLSHLADQEREAVLGRLTATIAHEVRNPLSGMRTAIGTLKRYGDRADAREEAVDFLDRGVDALGEVVNATLDNHRARPRWRPLSRNDFEDLKLLVEADGRERGVTVDMKLAIPDQVPVAALEVRQMLLNLLLNALNASPDDRPIQLEASLAEDEVVISIEDQGSGVDPRVAHSLESGEPEADPPGLGVSVVVRMVERLHGRVAVRAGPDAGTRVVLRIPVQKEDVFDE